MDKRLDLAEWLTVPEAATFLSRNLDDTITAADVLRLAMGGRLRISVNLVNDTVVTWKKSLGDAPIEEGEFISQSFKGQLPTIPAALRGDPGPKERSSVADGRRHFFWLGGETIIKGVWDLPMVGLEKASVEDEFLKLANGKAPTRLPPPLVSPLFSSPLAQTFVDGPDGYRCTIYERNEAGVVKGPMPVQRLPKDSILVVRREALQDFVKIYGNAPSKNEMPIETNERNTLLKIIAALCNHSHIKWKERGSARKIAEMTDKIGASVTEETIKDKLDQVEAALTSRSR